MNDNELTIDQSVWIGGSPWDLPLCVALPAYLRFNGQMDVQLRRLIACWSYTAAPIARGKASEIDYLRPQGL
jgi:hypothetical protein